MADHNDYDQKINREQNNSTSDSTGGTVWSGDSYHGYTSPNRTQYTYSTGSSGNPQSDNPQTTPPESNQPQYVSYGSYSPYLSEKPKKPKKERKHVVQRVLIGVLACLVVSAGSIAGFAWLINSGAIRIQQGSSGPAFTIVKNSSSGTVSTTNVEATTGELTKQQVAEKVLPSVVCIENYGTTSQKTQRGNSNQFGDNGEGQGGFTDGSDGTTGSDVSPSSEGSGIIMSSDGYIITNAHVVSGASSLKVVAYNGKTYSAKLVGSDSITDLALIKVDATGLKAAEFGSSGDMKVADTVMAIGNPGGLEFNSSVTVGYVSALNREITNSESGYTMKCIQTDAAINPGNSGGALVNLRGQVIGINSSKIVATGYEGLGFAIPINTAQPIISQLKEYGYVKDRAMLGITGTYIDSMTARYYGLDSGLYVYSVTSQYITSAGIQKSDVITKIDGKAVTSMNSVATAIASKKPGDKVTLTVSRASTGKTFTAQVQLSQATGKS